MRSGLAVHRTVFRHSADPGSGSGAPCTEQPVGDDPDEGDGEACYDAAPGIGFGQRDKYLLAEIARTNHGADDDHGKRHQNGLVDAEHDLRQSDRHLHSPEGLVSGAAGHFCRLNECQRHLANTMVGVTDGRHHGKRHSGDHGGDVANPKQHDDRDDEAEGR